MGALSIVTMRTYPVPSHPSNGWSRVSVDDEQEERQRGTDDMYPIDFLAHVAHAVHALRREQEQTRQQQHDIYCVVDWSKDAARRVNRRRAETACPSTRMNTGTMATRPRLRWIKSTTR